MERDKDPFFDDDPSLDPGPPPEDLWAVEAEPLKGEVSLSEDSRHEWEKIGEAPNLSWREVHPDLRQTDKDGHTLSSIASMFKYRCRRCGTEMSFPPWEDPSSPDENERFVETCTDLLVSKLHED